MEDQGETDQAFYVTENLNLETALKKAESTIDRLIGENGILKEKLEASEKIRSSLKNDLDRMEIKLENLNSRSRDVENEKDTVILYFYSLILKIIYLNLKFLECNNIFKFLKLYTFNFK